MSDNTADIVPLILRDLQAGFAELRAGQQDIRNEMAQMRTELRTELAQVVTEIRQEIRESNASIVALFSAAFRDHERRISDLETDVDKLVTPKKKKR
jgi:hypothetical protein